MGEGVITQFSEQAYFESKNPIIVKGKEIIFKTWVWIIMSYHFMLGETIMRV